MAKPGYLICLISYTHLSKSCLVSKVRKQRRGSRISPVCVEFSRRNHCGTSLVCASVLIDKVGPSVARLSHALVIVGGSQLRPPVIRGPLWHKGQGIERILICREELILTGSMHTFLHERLSYKGGYILHGILVFVKAYFCETKKKACIYFFRGYCVIANCKVQCTSFYNIQFLDITPSSQMNELCF